jgi:hypothetical protein
MDWKADLDALIKAVEALPTVKAGVKMFAGGLSKIAKAIATDATAVGAFADALAAKETVIADAVIANVPKATK